MAGYETAAENKAMRLLRALKDFVAPNQAGQHNDRYQPQPDRHKNEQ
jgi:hypothetical protein